MSRNTSSERLRMKEAAYALCSRISTLVASNIGRLQWKCQSSKANHHDEFVLSEETDTFSKLLIRNYERWGDSKVAMRKKEFGIWREYTWKDCY
jgi:hypothetical protein